MAWALAQATTKGKEQWRIQGGCCWYSSTPLNFLSDNFIPKLISTQKARTLSAASCSRECIGIQYKVLAITKDFLPFCYNHAGTLNLFSQY